MKSFPDQRRVDFVADGVWAIKCFTAEPYMNFQNEYQRCLFENTYGFEVNEEKKVKVFGKDFMAWAQPDSADDSIWEDAAKSFEKSPMHTTPAKERQTRVDEFEEAADEGGIQSLALGALDNSFLVSNSGIQVVRNFSHGIHGKGLSVKYFGNDGRYTTPKKVLLMKAETNMLLMSPLNPEKPHASGVHQLDIEIGKVATEWKFGKDGTVITMTDITNNSKGRRCILQILLSWGWIVLHWTQGHQFARGTNFQCFATAGDGSIVVGSLDGKIRLYSKSSMRMAKTAFPGSDNQSLMLMLHLMGIGFLARQQHT